MKLFWRALKQKPWAWGGALALLDLLWLLAIHGVGWIRTTGSGELFGSGLDFANSALRMWNTVHYPVRQLVEPILFPLVNANSAIPGSWVFHLYEAICILQSLLIGYLLGLAYSKLANSSGAAR